MTRSDNPVPNADADRLVDLLLGELAPGDADALEARVAADPALRSERDALAGVLTLEARRFDDSEAAAADDAPRLAASIVDRVRRDEAAVRRRDVANPKRRWARILAFSIGLHVVVLAVVAWKLRDVERSQETPAVEVSVAPSFDTFDNAMNGVNERLAEALAEMEAAELAELPDGVFLYDGDLDSVNGTTLEPLVQRRGDAPLFEHPHGMGLFLGRRTNDALKRRRLAALGFDADGTLSRVRRGLNYLRGLQRSDGSFAGENGISDLEQTALALLPFLGEGACSLCDDTSAPSRTVRSGMSWIRGQVFDESGAVRGGFEDRALGVALVALSEDYMLGYGRIGIDAARQRTHEIRRVGARVRAADSASNGDDALWPHWALDAAERTGALTRTSGELDRYDEWVATAVPTGDEQRVSVLEALTQGTALLHQERGTEKPRFLSWSRASADDLLGRLLPNGKAKGSEPGARIGDTALALLGLQVAYRTY